MLDHKQYLLVLCVSMVAVVFSARMSSQEPNLGKKFTVHSMKVLALLFLFPTLIFCRLLFKNSRYQAFSHNFYHV